MITFLSYGEFLLPAKQAFQSDGRACAINAVSGRLLELSSWISASTEIEGPFGSAFTMLPGNLQGTVQEAAASLATIWQVRARQHVHTSDKEMKEVRKDNVIGSIFTRLTLDADRSPRAGESPSMSAVSTPASLARRKNALTICKFSQCVALRGPSIALPPPSYVYTLYGDGGYSQSRFLRTSLSARHKQDANSARVSIEQAFGLIKTLFQANSFSKGLAAQTNTACLMFWNSVFFCNVLSCVRQDNNAMSSQFSMQPPNLLEYLELDASI